MRACVPALPASDALLKAAFVGGAAGALQVEGAVELGAIRDGSVLPPNGARGAHRRSDRRRAARVRVTQLARLFCISDAVGRALFVWNRAFAVKLALFLTGDAGLFGISDAAGRALVDWNRASLVK